MTAPCSHGPGMVVTWSRQSYGAGCLPVTGRRLVVRSGEPVLGMEIRSRGARQAACQRGAVTLA